MNTEHFYLQVCLTPKSRLQLSKSKCFLMLDALYLHISIGHGVGVDGRLS